MRLVMDRNGSIAPSLTQLITVTGRPTGAAGRRAVQLDQQRRKTARIALVMGVVACAASLGVLVGELARGGFGG
ncbi:hypothetical protein [Phenylobacterium aquaticum]|uniref:hypothetical protein n=1 Tax=Phenylobacterium aquaticum TaxID=1763816 RepID=UPI0026F20EFA|nr:hypothetical protein [Phenylobacterium aquaticum]